MNCDNCGKKINRGNNIGDMTKHIVCDECFEPMKRETRLLIDDLFSSMEHETLKNRERGQK